MRATIASSGVAGLRGTSDSGDGPEQAKRRDILLQDADVLGIAFPYPTRLLSRAPKLRFVHQFPAGVSNLMRTDLWAGPVPVTSGRGANNPLPIAEWAIGAALALSKQFPKAADYRRARSSNRRSFQGRQIAGKTLGVVGLGGIGREVARLGAALGMHVIGTRRSAEPVPALEQLYRPSELHSMLGRCDIVVVAAQLTDETYHVIDAAAIAAMSPGSFLINVARGELVGESPVFTALRSGHLTGFATDVYEGEFDHAPPEELMTLDNIIFTPHTSGQSEQR
ncbi:MAG TPA: NAD(P)-dependent oxidoreductase [Chloroflexota bacterium]|jgi:phosphoglycerate dehydrogenase-like enzyme|nr:NAD(P)-dependent oxidoreductase [Chloroflexota bacterium]